MLRHTKHSLGLGVLAVLLAVAAHRASGRELLQADIFPPNCNCVRTPSTSPFRLELGQPGSAGGYFQYCFKINRVPCDTSSKCCTESQGVNKVEFEVDGGCKGYLKRVTVDGRNHTAWNFDPSEPISVVRVTGLNKSSDEAQDTVVCLHLVAGPDQCSRLENFCTIGTYACKYAIFHLDRTCCPVGVTGLEPPPPPQAPGTRLPPPPEPTVVPLNAPPPPRSNFPNCTCDRDPLNSQITIKNEVVVSQAERNLTKMCFTLGTKESCNPDSACCNFTVAKVEFEANPDCATALAYQSIDGVIKARFFQTRPYPAIKVTGVNKPFSQVDGTEICLFLRPECNTLKKLGRFGDGTIVTTAMNAAVEATNCCPQYTVEEY